MVEHHNCSLAYLFKFLAHILLHSLKKFQHCFDPTFLLLFLHSYDWVWQEKKKTIMTLLTNINDHKLLWTYSACIIIVYDKLFPSPTLPFFYIFSPQTFNNIFFFPHIQWCFPLKIEASWEFPLLVTWAPITVLKIFFFLHLLFYIVVFKVLGDWRLYLYLTLYA